MSNRWERLSKAQAEKDFSYKPISAVPYSSATMDVIREAMAQAAAGILPHTRPYNYTPRFARENEMDKLRPPQEALLSEQSGWAIYTNNDNNRHKRDGNMLVHLKCNRHWPNWWLAPNVVGGAAHDPDIKCCDCQERLPLDAYHIFWGAYRLLNMKKEVKNAT